MTAVSGAESMTTKSASALASVTSLLTAAKGRCGVSPPVDEPARTSSDASSTSTGTSRLGQVDLPRQDRLDPGELRQLEQCSERRLAKVGLDQDHPGAVLGQRRGQTHRGSRFALRRRRSGDQHRSRLGRAGTRRQRRPKRSVALLRAGATARTAAAGAAAAVRLTRDPGEDRHARIGRAAAPRAAGGDRARGTGTPRRSRPAGRRSDPATSDSFVFGDEGAVGSAAGAALTNVGSFWSRSCCSSSTWAPRLPGPYRCGAGTAASCACDASGARSAIAACIRAVLWAIVCSTKPLASRWASCGEDAVACTATRPACPTGVA